MLWSLFWKDSQQSRVCETGSMLTSLVWILWLLKYCADREQLNVCLKCVCMLSMSNFAVALPCHTISSLGYYQSCIGPGTSILLSDRGIEVSFPGRPRVLSRLLNVQTGSVSARLPVSCAPVKWRRWAGTGRSFQGVKRPEHEAEYSPLTPSLSIGGAFFF
jgi:hypothetical protein